MAAKQQAHILVVFSSKTGLDDATADSFARTISISMTKIITNPIKINKQNKSKYQVATSRGNPYNQESLIEHIWALFTRKNL